MRLSFAFIVLAVAVVAVSAGIYPAKTGGKGAGHTTKGGSDDGADKLQDDRFHLQSPDGQYVFGHATGSQGRAEMRAKDGTVTGYYSYLGGNGELVYVNYVSDKDGYRVVSNTGVPSASVTIDGGVVDEELSQTGIDFQKVFSDFTKRIKGKVVEKVGQKSVDPIGEGQQQVTVDPIFYPSEETKHSNRDEKKLFPDYNPVTISTTKKPADEIKYDEGQQQQDILDPNWESVKITTQKSNIKGHDNDGQSSIDNDWKNSTDYVVPTSIPVIPHRPQVPTIEGYSDDHIQEIIHNPNSRIETEPTVIDDIQNNSPVTESVSTSNDGQTTVSYYDRPGQTIIEGSISRGDSDTTIADVKQLQESSTVRFSETATEHYHVIKENEEKFEIPLETNELTTIGPLDIEETFENMQITEDPGRWTDFQTTGVVSDVDHTTMKTVNEKVAIDYNTSPVYEPAVTTFQPEGRVGDAETTTAGVQYANKENEDDDIEFRTLEPTEIIGTTINPNYGQYEADVQEITWPEIQQEPVPQVMVPLDPYPEYTHAKNAGVKTQKTYLRPARHLDEVQKTTNVLKTENTTRLNDENTTRLNNENTTRLNDGNTTRLNDGNTTRLNNENTIRLNNENTTRLNNENTTSFDFPKYYITG